MDKGNLAPTNPKTLVLRDLSSGKRLVVKYLITPIESSKSINWVEVEVAGRDPKPVEYINASQWTSSIKVFLDSTDWNRFKKIGVRAAKGFVLSETELDQLSSHILTLYWPDGVAWPCVCKSIKKTEELFHPDTGEPTRVMYQLDLMGR